MSVGTYVTFGKFRTVHLGDLTKNKEFELMCPNNRIGTVDVLLGLHHGVDSSNSEVLVHALRPRVAIMNNGTRKGGQPEVMKTLHSSPGLEDLWQMHFSQLSGQEYTVPGMFIANLARRAAGGDAGRADVGPGSRGRARRRRPSTTAPPTGSRCRRMTDGSFTVTNARNGFSKTYRRNDLDRQVLRATLETAWPFGFGQRFMSPSMRLRMASADALRGVEPAR